MTNKVRSDDVAIIGMACLFPGAGAPERFWANICKKLELIGEPMPQWGVERYLGKEGSNGIPIARGGYLGEAYAADAVAMGVMPSSVNGSEPDHFLALSIAQAALADAGLDGKDVDHTNTGIILGHSSYLHRGNAAMVQHGVVLDQTRELLAQLLPDAPAATLDKVREAMAAQLPPFSSDIAPGLVPNVMTGRIANRLNFRGPNYLIDAACSSGLLALQSALSELRTGKSDLMLAGGVNASISAEVYMVFHQLGALSGGGAVRPFSEGGDGTLLGEGLGVLTLRRLSDALDAGDRIYAVVKGVGQSSDGRGAGLLAPQMTGEMLAVERALKDAGTADLPPPGLIEAHGTGIPLGDKTEIGALRGTYGGRADNGLPSTAIGSVKSMIGHCIPAAGAAGLIKTSLALYHKTLPPTLCDTVRAELGFETTALYVNNQPRPWLAPTGTKRRAAVNAFGFGGINAHAVLEEADGPAMAPSHWTTELFCISAADPAALAARARVMEAELAAHSGTELSSLAAYFAANAGSGPARLAFTAKDYDDLLTKLGKGADRLEAGKPRFRLRTGLFAADKPLEGKLAFIFPGEGAQYQGMLGETLMAFPEAREWFDFWDGLFPHRDIAPSTSVFPPPTTLSPELEKDLGERLFGLELGSESMFIAAQALLAVTKKLEIKPDAVVGHSSGEHSALAAAGIFGATDSADERADFANRIRSLNRLYQEIEAAGGIEGGALLTVGGVSRKRILEMTAAEPGLHLALDNCQHQAVLYGDRPLMEKVADALRQEGGITSFLPFDRPYHTPLFVGVAEKVAGVYADMEFRVPDLPIYSCATAAPMPNDPREIRVLAAGQWAARVRFTETIERLYADGVRLFLEVGPSANLTGFADDILKGRDAVCVAMDSRRRGGLDYLLQAMAQVWVSGRDMNIEALFASRVIDPVDLTVAPKPSRKRWIDNHLPYIRLPDDVAAPLAAELAQGRAVAPAVANILAPSAAVKIASNANISAIMPAQPATIGNDTVGNHFSLMQQFLDIQGNIMEAALGEGETAPQEWVPPLLHRIKQDENSLRAESDFDPLLDPFIAHHVLYAFEVSDADPDLQALPVLPLAVSLEMVAEAAAALTGIVPQALENVRARDWVAFDNGPATLTTLAQRLSDDRVAVQLKRGDTLLFEAEAVLGDAVPAAALPPLTAPKPPVWTEEQLYTTGMFHGPLFQGVARINGWDEGGLNATLKDMPLDGFFSDGSAPEGLLLNPALLDQTGHITAFWIAQGLGTDFSSFPSSIDRITLLDARVEATGGAQLSGRISFLDAQGNRQNGPDGARFLQGDFDCVAADGHLIAQVRGWKDRFFNVPHAFYEARYRTREAWYGAPAPLAAPDDVTLWSVPAFPLGFLEDAGGIWTRVLVTTILSASERTAYAALKGPGKRRRDWLMGRIALKEAVRAWIMKHHDLLLLPADIIIGNAPSGRPFVAAETLEILGVPGPVPVVSLSHSGGAALAACSAARAIGVDMELVGSVDPQLLAQGAFNPDELAFLGDSPAALTAGWCAKESVAKAFGQGLTGRPRSFKLVALDLSAGTATVDTPEGMRLQVQLVQHDDMVLAAAMAD